jgi:hypothetical protein
VCGGGGIAVTDLNLHFRYFPVHQLERKKEEEKKEAYSWNFIHHFNSETVLSRK